MLYILSNFAFADITNLSSDNNNNNNNNYYFFPVFQPANNQETDSV